MKEKIFIYGAGGLGREILAMIKMTDQWVPGGFFDDSIPVGTKIDGLEVKGGLSALSSLAETTHLVIAVGDPKVKALLAATIINSNIIYPVLVHPSAILQNKDTISIDSGTIITAGCILTTNITIGAHVLLNLNTTVGHDAVIGNYCSVMPGVNIAGEVHLGNTILIGSGANIKNRVRIGDQARIGMGSVVINDVKADDTVVGVPAKSIRR